MVKNVKFKTGDKVTITKEDGQSWSGEIVRLNASSIVVRPEPYETSRGKLSVRQTMRVLGR